MAVITAAKRTDRQIQQDVLAELNRDWRFKPAEVGVEVDSGIVTLTGTVSSYLKLGQAAEVAVNVPGVKDVANKLTVELAGTLARDDTGIARAVRDALEWDVVVPDEHIDSIVRAGVVTLSGTVDYWFQRKTAQEAVARLSGVKGVNDHIVIKPPARTDEQMYREIKEALKRRFPFDDIDLAVEKGTAILMGKVPSYYVRREAENVAWSTTGLKDVTNKLEVTF